MVTISDLSRVLGLSKTQVSRALNGFPDVSEITRKRVIETAREIGYRPNVLAQKLRRGRSGIVGLVLAEGSAQQEANILNEMLLGLAVEFKRRDTLVVLNVMPKGGTTVEAYERLTNDGRLDGFVVLNPNLDLPGIEFLQRSGMPVVVHGRHATEVSYPYVDIDNHRVGEMMAGHLIELGHHKLAFVEGPVGMFYADERFRGLEECAADAGISLRPDWIVRGEMTEFLGETAAQQFLSDPADRPTAIIAGNRVVATGLVRGIEAMGLAIPGDISIVAHDDQLVRYPADVFTPRLAGTLSPFSTAYDLLSDFLDRIIDKSPQDLPQMIVDPIFVQGDSTARPGSPDRD